MEETCNYFQHQSTTVPCGEKIWRESIPPKLPRYVWKLLHGRLAMSIGSYCRLCNYEEENQHLFARCSYVETQEKKAKKKWGDIFHAWKLLHGRLGLTSYGGQTETK